MTSDEQNTESELSNIRELEKQVQLLKQKLKSLVSNKQDDEDSEPQCIDWSLYEQQIGTDPLEFMKKHYESKKATIEKIRALKLSLMLGCLRFFRGANLSEKKFKLIRFLNRAPGYRTMNMKLLEQRLYITKRWMKENNIDVPMEDLPLQAKLDI